MEQINTFVIKHNSEPVNIMMYLFYRFSQCVRVKDWLSKTPNLKQLLDSKLEDIVYYIYKIENLNDDIVPIDDETLNIINSNIKKWINLAYNLYHMHPEQFSIELGMLIGDLNNTNPDQQVYSEYYINDNITLLHGTLLVTYMDLDEYSTEVEEIINSRNHEIYCISVTAKSVAFGGLITHDTETDYCLYVYEHYHGSELYDKYVTGNKRVNKYQLYSSALVIIKIFCNMLHREKYEINDNLFSLYKDMVGMSLILNNLSNIRKLRWKVDINEVSDELLTDLFIYAYKDLGNSGYKYCGLAHSLVSDAKSIDNWLDNIIEIEVEYPSVDYPNNNVLAQCIIKPNYVNNVLLDSELISNVDAGHIITNAILSSFDQ